MNEQVQVHSFLIEMSISIVHLQGDYSGALLIPVWPKRSFIDEHKKN